LIRTKAAVTSAAEREKNVTQRETTKEKALEKDREGRLHATSKHGACFQGDNQEENWAFRKEWWSQRGNTKENHFAANQVKCEARRQVRGSDRKKDKQGRRGLYQASTFSITHLSTLKNDPKSQLGEDLWRA